MKKIVLSALILVFMFALEPMVNTLIAQDPVQGYVASFNDLVAGKEGKMTKDQANSLMSAGQPIVFVAGNKVYFPISSDGQNAANMLTNFAETPKIGVLGQTKSAAGINFIVVQKARPIR